jgi:hypothetical protein
MGLNVLQVEPVQISQMKQTHLMGLMSFTRDQFAASFTTEKPAPAKGESNPRASIAYHKRTG